MYFIFQDAADWLSYTYLDIRMIKRPGLYGVPGDAAAADTPTLTKFRQDLIHTAAARLDKHQLIRYGEIFPVFFPDIFLE